MNNEEKAKSIVCFHCNQQYCKGLQTVKSCPKNKEVNNLVEMAKWKDEQFDKKLQEIVDYVYPLICGGERLHINEIIGKDMKWQHK